MTGDHAITAQAVGREIGLAEEGVEPPVITGQELHSMSDSKLTESMEEHNAMIFWRVSSARALKKRACCFINILITAYAVIVKGSFLNSAVGINCTVFGFRFFFNKK